MSLDNRFARRDAGPARPEGRRASLFQAIALAAASALTAEGCAAGNARDQLRNGDATREEQLYALESRGSDISERWSASATEALGQVARRLGPQDAELRRHLLDLQRSILPFRIVEERFGRSQAIRDHAGQGEFTYNRHHSGLNAEELSFDIERFRQANDACNALTPQEILAFTAGLEAGVIEGEITPRQVRQLLSRLRPGLELSFGHGREFNHEPVRVDHLSRQERELLVVALSHAFTQWPDIPADFMRRLMDEGTMEYGVAVRLNLCICHGGNLGDNITVNHNWEDAFNEVDPQGTLTSAQRELAITRINLTFAQGFARFLEDHQL